MVAAAAANTRALSCSGVGCTGHDAAPEAQQSLVSSWAEFLAQEPVKPKGRNGRPKPSSLSLFEWAFSLEQEREEEPVGTGR